MKDENTFIKLDTDLSFEDEFDPLEDLEPDEDAEEEPHIYTAPPETAEPVTASVLADNRPAAERIDDLLFKMATRRRILLQTVELCQTPQAVASVNEFIDEQQKNNLSVYSAATLCDLLEKAGAIEKVDANGQAIDETTEEPDVVVVDGVEYLEPKKPIDVYWMTTDAGREALSADKPLERLQDLFEEDEKYLVIYKRILTLCSQEDGAATPEIDKVVDDDPLVQEPRLYGPHFVDKLEKCDALVWKKIWTITEIGKRGLDLLADVEDSSANAEDERA